jgi:hypothetical protein
VIASPTPSTTLSGSDINFVWPDVGADEYSLFVGYLQAHSEIFADTQGVTTNQLVMGLPADGRAVWVRIWTRFGTDWTFTDAEYTSDP